MFVFEWDLRGIGILLPIEKRLSGFFWRNENTATRIFLSARVNAEPFREWQRIYKSVAET